MAYASSFPQRTPYSTNAEVVRFAPVQDSETGDDMLEPPFVRVRAGNSAFMYIDTSIETQFNPAINDASWIVGAARPLENSHIFAHKVKRQSLVAVEYMWATPNINPTNRELLFRTADFPLADMLVVLPTYNYLREFTSPATPLVTAGPTVTAVPVTAGYGNEVDSEDGLLTKMVDAMNATYLALHPLGPAITFTVSPSDGYRTVTRTNYNNSNVLFWSLRATYNGISPPTAVPFIFTGGTVFTRGNYLFGTKPIPATDFTNTANYYPVYTGGPVSFLYTRWIDVTSRALTLNAKMLLSGTDVPPNLVCRVYIKGVEDQAHGVKFVEVRSTATQWLNWIKSQSIVSVDLQMRDEFGELIEVPQQGNNASWLNLILVNEL